MSTRIFTFVTICALFCSTFSIGLVAAESDVIVSGYAYDNETGEALAGVKVIVEEEEDGTIALTNKNGKYTLVISGRTEARISFIKKGYKILTTLVKLTERNLRHDVRLQIATILIEMTEFSRGSYIKGKVRGLDRKECDKYKVLVYVLTDKWYIHPYAENKVMRGYAVIDSLGNWEIETVWRGYQAYNVAFLLVEKDLYTPPTVRLLEGKEPEMSLINTIKSLAYNVVKAPEGI